MSEFILVRVVVKIMVPFILLFALYVQMHGDYGPGAVSRLVSSSQRASSSTPSSSASGEP